MGTFNNISDMFVYVFIIPVLLTFADLIWNLRALMTLLIGNHQKNERWAEGNYNLEDLYSLTPKEFQIWCTEFISKLGYEDIHQDPAGSDSGKDIICTKDHVPVYVECKRYWYSKDATYMVDEQICKKLVGVMVHDCVTKGLIITSGYISKSAISYIRTLPKNYEIELLDGEDILKEFIRVRNLNLQTI